jgi:hypothetical protein
MGFNKKNVRDISRRILMEISENMLKPREYLRKKQELENEYPYYLWVYLDKIYIHKNLMTNEIYSRDPNRIQFLLSDPIRPFFNKDPVRSDPNSKISLSDPIRKFYPNLKKLHLK